MKVRIENLYYLFCYAWKFIPEELVLDVGSVTGPDVLNLCAHILTAGIDRLLRQGLDRGYEGFTDQISPLRGRIDFAGSLSGMTWLNGRAVCRFDDLSVNVLHNQILRSTVQLLRSAPLEKKIHNRLCETDRRLSGIEPIRVTSTLFRRVQLHRNNSFYAFLMRVCELVNASLLPVKGLKGEPLFCDLLKDEKYMAAVFEEFLRNFYRLKQCQFTVGRSTPKWNAAADDKATLGFLPHMMTDLFLSSKSREIIIDAKYYADALQTNYNVRKVHSSNLYQLLAYLRGTPWKSSLEGALVYPVGEQKVDLSFTIDGYVIRIYTVNLDQEWTEIEADLLGFIA